jgi:DnaJ-class molecular chaperone
MNCPFCNIELARLEDDSYSCESKIYDHNFKKFDNGDIDIIIWVEHSDNFLREDINLDCVNGEYFISSETLGKIKISAFDEKDYRLVLDRFAKIKSFI